MPALKDLSFSLDRGETLGLVGESGSGKSITSLVIMGLLRPSEKVKIEGEVLFYQKGKAIDLLKAKEGEIRPLRGRKMAMIFQEPMTALNPVQRCGPQVAEALRNHQNCTKKQAHQKVIEWFNDVKLPEPEKLYFRYPHELSGGQKQRVMIAMALCGNPSLIIADEPTTALDVTVQKSILNLIHQMQIKHQIGVLFITHDLGVVNDIADRVLVLYKGKLMEQGAVKNVLNSPQSSYTKGLLACRPSLTHFYKRLPTVGEYMSGKTPLLTERVIKAVTPDTEKLLSINNIETRYPTKTNFWGRPVAFKQAVDLVTLDVYKGETLGLVGESGCGKTTLGRTMIRLIDPHSGQLIFKGSNLFDQPEAKLRKNMQLIFQDPNQSLNPLLPIGRAVQEVFKHWSKSSVRESRQKTIDLLVKVGLDESYFERYPHELSGGQKQRVCIARALAVKPEFIVCDESVSALDVSVQAQILNLFSELKEEFGLTYVFISHDLSVIRHISDRILVMKEGQIVEEGTPISLFKNPKTNYTKTLIQSIPGIS